MLKAGLALAGVLLVGVSALCGEALAATLESIGPDDVYDSPTHVASDPRDPNRLFVTQKAGRIDVTSAAGTSLFLDLTAETDDAGERGLWSIAFPADFAQTGLFYVAYAADDGALTLDEYREQPTPAETKATRRLVLSVPPTATSFHNGGQLQFGPDGYLYWATGEKGVIENSQTTANLHGKILRIDPRQSGADPYSVPATNPFVGIGGAQPEIWSYGLRNPWRFSFDRATGALVIADVGSGGREEIDYATQASGGGRGANYGWPICEGFEGPPGCSGSGPVGGLTPPIYDYVSNDVPCNAITGGYVVRDSDLGDLLGRYLFTDYCAGDLRSIDPAAPPLTDQDRSEGLAVDNPVSFGEDVCGRLYVVSQGAEANTGQVFRIEGPTGGACPPESGFPPSIAADADPPETTLRLKRKSKRSERATAMLESDEPGSTFECKLERRDWKPCGAKRKLKHLDPGRHRFRARATDLAGNTDPTPAKKRFKTLG